MAADDSAPMLAMAFKRAQGGLPSPHDDHPALDGKHAGKVPLGLPEALKTVWESMHDGDWEGAAKAFCTAQELADDDEEGSEGPEDNGTDGE